MRAGRWPDELALENTCPPKKLAGRAREYHDMTIKFSNDLISAHELAWIGPDHIRPSRRRSIARRLTTAAS